MASDVNICNLALGHLGQSPKVSSINPPDGSVEAQLCSQFYPMARDALLEQGEWGFNTTRSQLALLASAWPEWTYAYAVPANALNLLAVLPPAALDDYSVDLALNDTLLGTVSSGSGLYQPQPFSIETLTDGTQVIYSDQQYAVLRYTFLISDTSQFSPTFVAALSLALASYLAGPILKGATGRQVAASLSAQAQKMLGISAASDANQRKTTPAPSTPWLVNR